MRERLADLERLKHILEAINEIEKYLSCINSEDEFYNHSALKFATVKQLEIIGEAASKLSEEITDMESELEWRAIIAVRNRLVHDYERIDKLNV